MASSKFEGIWRLMHEYSFEADPASVKEDLSCLICKQLMIDACQSACGCQYCHNCIVDYLNDQNKYCPGGKEECREEYLVLEGSIFRNMRMNNKIYNLIVICPNRSCQSKMELSQMEDHLKVCSKESTKCPYSMIGCENMDTSKEAVLKHIQNDSFRHSILLMEGFHTLRNEVEEMKHNLTKSKFEISSLREELRMNEMFKKEIATQLEEERRQVRDMLAEHSRQLNERNIEMIVQIEDLNREMKGQKIETELIIEESRSKEVAIGRLQDEVFSLVSKVEAERRSRSSEEPLTVVSADCLTYQGNIKVFQKATGKIFKDEDVTIVEGVRKGIEDIEGKLNAMKMEIQSRNTEIERRIKDWNKWNKLISNIDFDFVWKIEEFTNKMEAFPRKEIFSEPFHCDGYRLCLSMYLDGDNIGCHCHIMEGSMDGQLIWPMARDVTITVLDRASLRALRSITYCHETHLDKTVFCRPDGHMNAGIGEACFISYSDLRSSPSIIDKDCFVVLCSLGDRV